jgi:flavorubredoxin
MTKPYEVADDTWVIPQLVFAPPIGYVYFNSALIRGSEPVVVDTGAPVHREDFLETLKTLVDPEDVRWIFLSHDDRDHAGNLMPLLEACPNATLLTTWFTVARMVEEWPISLRRCRFLDEDQSFEAGGRMLATIRPPFFDSPVTRALFDSSTGFFWSVDSFATSVPHAAQDVGELDRSDWEEGVRIVNCVNHPWHQWLDETKWGRHVDQVESLGINVIAGCHTPSITGATVAEAFRLIRKVPAATCWQVPDQAVLEAWCAAGVDVVSGAAVDPEATMTAAG